MLRVLPTLVLLLAIALVSVSAGLPQEEPAPEPAAVEPTAFPATWYGTWRGDCRNVRPGDHEMMTFPMELTVAATDDPARARWVIVYGKGAHKQVRNYELITVDARRGHFRIDEKNSIVLEAYRVGETLHQCFSLGRTLLHVRFTKRGGAIGVEMASFRFDQPTKTGGKNGAPAVSGYRLQTVQRGRLARVSPAK